jgi:hypothetical protein
VDAYVGGLAEPHYGSAHVGQLFYASIFDQFRRLRDGDWYHLKNADNGLFDAQEIAEIERTGGEIAGARGWRDLSHARPAYRLIGISLEENTLRRPGQVPCLLLITAMYSVT